MEELAARKEKEQRAKERAEEEEAAREAEEEAAEEAADRAREAEEREAEARANQRASNRTWERVRRRAREWKNAWENAWENARGKTQEETGKTQEETGKTREKTPLEMLGLPESATAKEIKRAYRQLALKWHPDKHPAETREQAHKMFVEIFAAYQALTQTEGGGFGHPGRHGAHHMHMRRSDDINGRPSTTGLGGIRLPHHPRRKRVPRDHRRRNPTCRGVPARRSATRASRRGAPARPRTIRLRAKSSHSA